MAYINLNGKILTTEEARLPVDNGAFRYGYGLFETMLVRNGEIELKEYHWDRLFDGMKQLYFELPVLLTRQRLEDEVLKTVKRNKLEQLCRVRLQVFAGGGGMYSSENNVPGYVIECFPLTPEMIAFNENGLEVGVAVGLSKTIDSLSNLKSCNALIYAMAARQARGNKWNDALICNTRGHIIESTIANIFWVKNGTLYTQPLSEGCVAGVMRRHLMEQYKVVEKVMNTEELMTADEVMLTNSIRKIRWVGKIGDKKYQCKTIKDII